MNRGERIANRTKSAVKKALLECIREKNYPDITVGEITEIADVGRSTFYRHYQSKAEVLVDIHRDMFVHLFSGLSSADLWIAPEPPAELAAFFKKCQRLGLNPFSLSYKLGSDLDFLVTNITRQLTITIEERLRDSYDDAASRIPISVLAQSVSGLYNGLIMSWFTRFQSFDTDQFAAYIHRMTGALICEAFERKG